MKGIRLNIAVEQDDHSFLKLTIKVRDKIVADGLNDASFDVMNRGIHLGANDFKLRISARADFWKCKTTCFYGNYQTVILPQIISPVMAESPL